MVLISIMLCSLNVRAEIDYPITPESLQNQVKQRSLAEVHDELFSHPYAMNMLLLAIDSAEPDWLDVAILFLQEQNPISGPRLLMAVGEGLQWYPANILQRDFPLEKICSLDGLYEWRRFSRFLATTSIHRRLMALEKLAKTNVNGQKCQQLLVHTRDRIPTTMSNMLPEHSH